MTHAIHEKTARLLTLGGIFACRKGSDAQADIGNESAFRYLSVGLGSFLAALLISMAENIPSLNGYFTFGAIPIGAVAKNGAFLIGFIMTLRGIGRLRPLVSQLRAAQEQLRRCAVELDHEVKERTAELGVAIDRLGSEETERDKMERDLRESEEKYRLHFEYVNEVIYSYDTGMRIVTVSPSVERLIGHPPSEIVGKHFGELALLMPEELPRALEEARLVLSGETISLSVFRFIAKDGAIRYGEVSAAPIRRNGSVVGAVCVARDITDRLAAEKALLRAHAELEDRVQERTVELAKANEQLQEEVEQRRAAELAARESEEKYRLVVENAMEGMFVIQEGYVRFANRSAIDQSGYTQEEVFSRPFIDFVHPDDRATVLQNYLARIRGEKAPGRYLLRAMHAEKDPLWLQCSPVVVTWEGKPAVLTFAVDVSERVEAERDLKEKEQRLELALEAGQLGMWDWHVSEGRIELAERCTRMLGFQASEVEPTVESWLRAIHREDRARVKDELEVLRTGTSQALEQEYRIREKSGEWRWWLTRGHVTERAPNGDPVRVTGTNLDITGRKIAEEDIKASLREKEALLRELHHRVKNNMQLMSSMLSIQSSYSHDDRVREVFKEAESRIRAMALVQENLYSGDDLAPIQAADYIRKLVVGLAAGYTSVECRPVVDIAVDQIALTRDTAVPLGLILNELVTNCFKHAFRGVADPTLSVGLRRTDERRLELVVADNGTGMVEGLNLSPPRSFGLDLVRTLVGQLGGTLELDRTEGTRFRITCPYSDESPGEAA